MLFRTFIICALAIFGMPMPATAQAEQVQCGIPVPAGDWEIEKQSDASIAAQPLCDLINKLARDNANVHSVLGVHGGKLVFEHYRAGADQRWGTNLGVVVHGPDVKHDVRSVSKSVISLLIGIALDRKLITSIDEPVFKLLPEHASLRTPRSTRITLRHLLTMSSGIEWDEKRPYTDPLNSERRMVAAGNPYRFVLQQPLTDEPGSKWNYSGGSTTLLSAVLERVTGKSLAEFARQALFEPLGIDDFEWVRMRNGEYAAASGLRLRSRDMAKLGQLMLSQGEWKGKRVVSANWLRESVTPRFQPEPSYRYGYHWWIGSSQRGPRKVEWFEAYGLGSQRIIVVPSANLVVVFTTGLYEADDPATTELLDNYILPAAFNE